MSEQGPGGLAASLLVTLILLTLPANAWARPEEILTRVSASTQTYWVEQIAEGLNFPSSVIWLPDGDMLITERMGGLRIVEDGKLDPKPVSGTPESYRTIVDGLKDIVLDPDYKMNSSIFLLMSEGTSVDRYAAVYRARYSAAGLRDVVRVFRARYDSGGEHVMFVTRMTFLHDKTLLLGIADGVGQRAQQLDSYMGKILRINRDGSIPNDNPFVSTPGALPEVWSYGHRVPLGMCQDGESGILWEIESGPSGGDELNVLKAGSNYGWGKASWGFNYMNKGLAAPLQSGPGIEDPVLVWTPSVTPSGLAHYRGNIYPLWNGDYFLGHLTKRRLERLRLDGDRVVLQERMLLDLDARIRDVKVGPDNHLYILTDHQNGKALRLQPGTPRANELSKVARKYEPNSTSDLLSDREEREVDLQPADVARGRQAFIERCAICHSVGTVVQGGEIGPELNDIYGAKMGARAGFDYSPNMKVSDVTWNYARLDRFLANPDDVVPGTKMASTPVLDSETRRQIIGFLKQQTSGEVNR